MSSSAAPEITVCVFAWNEAETVGHVVEEIVGVLRTIGKTFEVVVIDDGSEDGTGAAADRVAADISEVRVIHHAANEGLGGVYRTGFETARGKFLSFFPGDGQFPASIIPQFYALAPEHDLVLGYLQRRTDVIGRTLSTVERVLYRAIVGGMPRFQGVFMIRTSELRAIPLLSEGRGWAILMELVIRANRRGLRLISVPTEYRPRTVGQSKVNNLKNIRANMKQLLGMRRLLANDPPRRAGVRQ